MTKLGVEIREDIRKHDKCFGSKNTIPTFVMVCNQAGQKDGEGEMFGFSR